MKDFEKNKSLTRDEIAARKERKSIALTEHTQDYPENFIIKIPLNTNTYRLSRLFNVDPTVILRKI